MKHKNIYLSVISRPLVIYLSLTKSMKSIAILSTNSNSSKWTCINFGIFPGHSSLLKAHGLQISSSFTVIFLAIFPYMPYIYSRLYGYSFQKILSAIWNCIFYVSKNKVTCLCFWGSNPWAAQIWKSNMRLTPLFSIVNDRNHYFGLGPITNPRKANTFWPIPLLAQITFQREKSIYQ